MSTEFEEALMGLDFAQHPPDMTTKNVVFNMQEKQKRQLKMMKQQVIAINDLLPKYREAKVMLSTTEKLLSNLKTEYKLARDEAQETCKNYKSTQERCAALEKEVALLQNKCKQLEMDTQINESKEAAAQSYTNQLQALIKDHELTIEALKLEINLVKDGSQKKITKMNRIITALIKHLGNVAGVVFRKKNLNKAEKMSLYKYWKIDRLLKDKINRQKICELVEEEPTSEDLIMFEDFMSEQEDAACEDSMVNSSTIDEIENGDDSDTSISEDTGRGSSLACSDKEFVSPSYFNESQSNIKTVNNKNKHADSIADTTTVNPTTAKETKEIATSPIRPQRSDQATTPLKFDSPSRTDIPDIVVTIDGPVNSLSDNNDRDCTEVQFTSLIGINEIVDGIAPLSSVIDKQALDKNSHLYNENSNDGEVEMILENMRVGLDLVTPIPTTPARSISRSTVMSRANRDSQNETAKMLEIRAEVKNMRENLLQNIIKDDEKTNVLQNYLRKIIKNVLKDTISTNIENKDNRKPCDKRISEKNNNDNEKECGEQLDEYDLLDEDPIILNHSYNAQNENEKESSAVSPTLKQKLLLIDELSQNKDSDKVDVIDTTDNVKQSPRKEDKKTIKVKKLTKLEKLRKTFLPKSKIKKDDLPQPRKLRSRLIVPITQQENDVSAASLNNKEAYDKAVKIMTEIKSKQKDSKTNNKKKDDSGKNCNNQDLNGSLNPTVAKSSKHLINVRTNDNSKDNDSNNKGNNNSCVSINNGYDNKREKSVSPLKKVQTKKRQNSGELIQSQIKRVETRSSRQSTESNDSITLAELLSLSPRRKKSNSNSDRQENRNTTEVEEKSLPKFDCVKISNRTKYPSFSLDKDVVVVLDQSDIKEQIKRIVDVNKETVNINKCKENDVGMSAMSPDHAETNCLPSIISYTDLDLFSDEPAPKKQRLQDEPTPKKQRLQGEPALNQRLQYDPPKTNNVTDVAKPHESILCQFIEKHGITSLKVHGPKVNEAVVDLVHEKIEKGILQINELPLNNNKREMNNLVESLKKLKYKDFLSGLLKYLADPQRKLELYNKVNAPPAPPMTKSEQVLLYLVMKLKGAWPNVDIVNQVLKHIEYNLFKLNGTPDFEVIESMAHFYAVLCRYINSKSRLKLFMLDAMYCMSFKAIPLIKQCLEVWMHILPLAHMGTAKSPLVTCIVYLLHYYKTKDDRFNRVQEIRNILSHRYFFKVTEWNENRILEMFKNAILDLKESPVEKKMLRLALIILAKRQGARWCQTKLITNLLQPLINRADVSERAKTFCVSLLGPIVKPYPMDMKVHREIILNQLLDLTDTNLSPAMAEAVFVSLISINRHNQNRVIGALLKWHPEKVSQELETILKDFVKEKPVKAWKKLLRQIYLGNPN